MTIDELNEEIDVIGNIKVIFEPKSYSETRFPKKELQEILEKSQISLRGWSFPHIPRENRVDGSKPYSIGNGVQFYTSWGDMMEIFRFYQSGQFLAKFAMREDTIGTVNGKVLEPGKYLDFLGLIYRITEIVLFIKNLIQYTDIEGGRLTIEFHNVRDRELESVFSRNILSFNSGYICRMNEFLILRDFDREKILNESTLIAREIIGESFENFNWMNYSPSMIQTHQDNFLSRKF